MPRKKTIARDSKGRFSSRKVSRSDAYANFVNGFGGIQSTLQNTSFQADVLLDQFTLEIQYRHNWIARRIIEIPAQDATREFFEFQTDDEDIVTRMNSWYDDVALRKNLEKAIKLARLYGGAGMVLGIDDGRPSWEPLDTENMRSFKFINVLDRHQLQRRTTVQDAMSPNFGQPETYHQSRIAGQGASDSVRIIHASRVIRFDGVFLPDQLSEQQDGWGDPVLQPINQELKRFGVSVQSGADLLQDFVLRILKMRNLAEMIAAGKDDLIIKRMQAALNQFSIHGIALIGDEEELDRMGTPVQGLAELMDKYIDYVAAAADIPRARLFNQQLGQLAGANETTREYFDRIKSFQNNVLKAKLERLNKLVLKVKDGPSGGNEPENWSFEFNPLWQMTEEQQVQMRSQQANIDQVYIQNNVLDPAEVRSSRFREEGYSIETVTDDSLTEEVTTKGPEEFEDQTTFDEGHEDDEEDETRNDKKESWGTSFDEEHIHEASIDENGNGETIRQLGGKDNKLAEHVHKVINFKIQEAKGHKHRLLKKIPP